MFPTYKVLAKTTGDELDMGLTLSICVLIGVGKVVDVAWNGVQLDNLHHKPRDNKTTAT